MDIGRCLCINLRQGMFIALAAQAVIVGVNIALAYIDIINPNLQIFFFAKGIELNGPAVMTWTTGVLMVLVGLASLPRSASAGTVKLWLLLSIAIIPLQFMYGGMYAFRCLLIFQDLTPTIAIANGALSYTLQGAMPKMADKGAGPPRGQSKLQVKDALKARMQEGFDFESKFLAAGNEAMKTDPPKDTGTITSYFRSWGKYLSEGYEKNQKSIVFAGLGAILIAMTVVGAVTSEAQVMYGIYPPPINKYYLQGQNFLLTFALRAFLYVIVLSVLAVHIAAYAAVKERGGTGEESVGYRRIRWFYRLSPENRRRVRAGGQLLQMRKEAPEPDSDDSGTDLEHVEIKDEQAEANAVDLQESMREQRRIKMQQRL